MQTLYIFDIDGVITNPYLKKPNLGILAFIADQLSQKKPVMLATGRAVAWIEKNIIPSIRLVLKDQNDIDLLFISAEKGGVSATYSQGILESTIDPRVTIPTLVKEEVIKKLEEYEGVFFDYEKQTMVSIEAEGTSDIQKIEGYKKNLSEIAVWVNENIIIDLPQFMIDHTEIALDIQGKDINKRISATDFRIFLQAKGITATIFLVFGDSPTDALLADELYQKGYAVSFGYVGKKIIEEKFMFPIFYPKDGKLFDEGVVELLSHT